MLINFLLQADLVKWYDTPTGAAAIVAVIGVISAPFINSWLQNRKQTKDSTGHLTDTSLTLATEERKEIINQMRINHAAQVRFLQAQLDDLELKTGRAILDAKVSEYEARKRAHAQGNESQRLQGHVYMLQTLLARNDIQMPDFDFKTYPEIMSGVDDQVNEYKESLEVELKQRLEYEKEERDAL